MKPLEIIFENEQLIAINKPSGLLSIPDREQSEPSLKDLLLSKYGNIYTVHRLDRDTSGIILFAKDENTHKFLSQQFENRETEKFYNGLVMGKMQVQEGLVDQPIMENPARKGYMITHAKGKASITSFKVMELFNAYSWVEFKILTGRTHQIRVHSKFLGHPIVCDPMYGDGQPLLLSSIKRKFKMGKYELEEKPLLNRLCLHARKLVITEPNGTTLTLEAIPPKDMRAALQQLEKWGK